MANAKVVLNNEVLMDITDTTATASDVIAGKVIYTADGVRTVGTGNGGSGEPGIPSGGAAGEILTKVTSTDYDVTWSAAPVQSVNGKTGVITLSASDVGALSSNTAIPSNASDVGAIAAPASASVGQILSYNGSSWVAEDQGHSLPSGGTTGQVLAKSSNDDYTVEWVNNKDPFPINITRSGDVYSADKTWQEINNAYIRGKLIYILYNGYQYDFIQRYNNLGIYEYTFSYNYLDSLGVNYQNYFVITSSEISFYSRTAGTVPSAGLTGQVLAKSSDGDFKVSWQSIPVTSVNNKTGTIVLTASDVNALPSTTTASDIGAIPAPASASADYVLGYNGSAWVADKRTFIAKYGISTYAEVLSAYQANKIMYCRASSNSNPASGDQLRLAFLAYVNNEAAPTEFEFQYYRSVKTHSYAQQGDQMFVYKLKQTDGWSVEIRESYTKIIPGVGLSSAYSNSALTLSLDTAVVASAAPIQSVNNQTGVVTLSASDVGALPSDTFIPSTASDVGALPSDTFIPSSAADVGGVALSGDTMTGTLAVKNSGIDIDNDMIATTIWGAGFNFVSASNSNLGLIHPFIFDNGKNGLRIAAYRNNYSNEFQLRLDSSGNQSIYFSSPSAWREALGLGATSGALPITNGGTGATSASDARQNLGVLGLTGGTVTGQVKSTYADKDGFAIEHGASSKNACFNAKRTDTGTEVFMGVGAGGVNHGVYSGTLGKWIAYADASNIYLNGNAENVTGIIAIEHGGTGGTSLAEARKNLGLPFYETLAGTTYSFTVTNGTRFLMFTSSANDSLKGLFIFNTPNVGGTPTYVAVQAASGVTITTSSNAFTVKMSNAGFLGFLIFGGSITKV